MSDFDLSETVGELENMVNVAWDAGYAKGVDWAKKCGGGIDAMTDAELAEHGLVRLPVDADGVTWTGTEHEYSCQRFDGTWKNKPLFALAYDAKKGKWTCLGSYTGNDAASSRHVKDEPEPEPADTPASLADELDALTVRGFEDDELHDLADRLRAIGGGCDD